MVICPGHIEDIVSDLVECRRIIDKIKVGFYS